MNNTSFQQAYDILHDRFPPGTTQYTCSNSALRYMINFHRALSAPRFAFRSVPPCAPPQSVGDVDCVSIMKNSKNLEAAKKFVDFVLSSEAQELMASINFATPVNPDAKQGEGAVNVDDLDLIDYDVVLAAEQKDTVLEKWSQEVK